MIVTFYVCRNKSFVLILYIQIEIYLADKRTIKTDNNVSIKQMLLCNISLSIAIWFQYYIVYNI